MPTRERLRRGALRTRRGASLRYKWSRTDGRSACACVACRACGRGRRRRPQSLAPRHDSAVGWLGLLLGRHRGRLCPPADQGGSGLGSVEASGLDWVSTMFGNVKQTLEGTCLCHLAEFGYRLNRRFDLALPVLAVGQIEISLDDHSAISAMTGTKDEGRPYGHQDGRPHPPLRKMLAGRWCRPLEELSSESWSIHEIHTPSETSVGVTLWPRRCKARARLLSDGFLTWKAEEELHQ